MLRDRVCTMPAEAFERLGKQLVMVTGNCSDAQLLELADTLHATIRQRREAIYDRNVTLDRHDYSITWRT